MLMKEGKDVMPFLDLTKDEAELILKQIDPLTTEDILYILYSLINTNNMMYRSPSPKIALELLAVKLSQKESIVSLGEIMRRLSVLEKEAGGLALNKIRQPQAPAATPAAFNSSADTPAGAKKEESQAKDTDIADADSLSQLEPTAELYRIREAMSQVIKEIKQQKIYVASCLAEGKIAGFKNNTVILGFYKKNTFHRENLEKQQNKKLIEEQLSKILGSNTRVDFVTIKDDSASAEKGASQETQEEPQKNPLKKALSDPIIKTALDIFDGSIMKLF
jgi:DNA polymerase-3 subunit gamma/tau